MTLLLAYAALLLLAVLLAERARRTVLSTSVLFLAGGLLLGPSGAGLLALSPEQPALARFVELTLFAVLFGDGMMLRPDGAGLAWRLAGRALLLGMPLVFAGTALLGHALLGIPWVDALLVGAVLAPTDPVFASALMGRAEVPARLRSLLNLESGLNDGLALPVVVLLLAAAEGAARSAEWLSLLGELAAGVAIGIALPWLVLRAKRLLDVKPGPVYEPLLAFAIGLLVWGTCTASHANPYLAAFSAGITVGCTDERVVRDFERFGEIVSELLKLGALLLLGVLVAPASWNGLDAAAWIFAVLAFVAVRPLALLLVLVGSPLDRRERLAAAWFGPKGFAAVAYTLLIVRSDVAGAQHLYHVLALVITLSIVSHSSTDVLVARWFQEREAAPGDPGVQGSRASTRRSTSAPPSQDPSGIAR